MTAHEIQRALAVWIDYRRHLCLPNMNGGIGFWSRGEMDFVAVTGAHYLIEIEIKTSLADLRREWRTASKIEKHHKTLTVTKGIRRYFICVPRGILEKARAEIEAQPLLAYAGILSVLQPQGERQAYVRVERKAQNLKTARKLSPDDRMKIGHLAAMRLWDRA